MKILRLLMLGTLGLAALSTAHADYCKFQAERSGSVDAAGATRAVIRVGAGDLEVRGTPDAARVAAQGRACASSQALLDALQLSVRRDGDVIHVEGSAPQNVVMVGTAGASMDVGVALPPGLPVEIQDSSGDTKVTGLDQVSLRDSSGDIEVTDIGSIDLEDSSGDIRIDRARGDVLVNLDSSGDIGIHDVGGRVEIGSDGSGEIRVERVAGSVTIGADGSGEIVVQDVKGDFTVGSDGSGGIVHRNIGGKISVPQD